MKQVFAKFSALVFLGAFFFTGSFVVVRAAEDNRVLIEVLERLDCVHCQAEKAFLTELDAKRDDVEVRFYDIGGPEGSRLFDEVTAKAKLSKSTPITVVGTTVTQGFDAPETTGKSIEGLIERNRGKEEQGFEAFLRSGEVGPVERGGATCEGLTECVDEGPQPFFVKIPLVGPVDVTKYSLPALAATLGFLDGFNPCAMWVLVTFLIVLVQIGSKGKMWTVAGLFILAEAIMYYLILNVWFTTWDFVGMDRFVTPAIGALAVAGGLFFLYEWYKSLGTEMACRVIDAENRSKIVRRIKDFANRPLTLVTAAGIVGLAFSVNVIEFACSVGYPQAFTKIIEMNALDFWQTQGYMALYILFYMVDDFLVFGLALWGFDKIHLTQSYSKWSALVGGVFMLLLGYLLIFSPEVLRSLG
jgi:cytochrome c biogenesis protein CcdA